MEMNVGELWTVKKMAEYFSLSEGAYLIWQRKLGARGPRALRLVVKGLGPRYPENAVRRWVAQEAAKNNVSTR